MIRKPKTRLGMAGAKNLKGRPLALKIAFVALPVLLVAAFFVALSVVNVFPLDGVSFYGNRHIGSGELRELSGLKDGEDVLGICLKDVENRLTKSPWVKKASVRKEYPDHVAIRIVEAVPSALLKDGEDIYIVGADGEKLEAVKGDTAPFLPMIVFAGSPNKKTFDEAVKLAGVLKSMNIKNKTISIIGVEGGAENLALSVDRRMVKIGEGRHKEKISKYLEIEAELSRRWNGIAYVDMRFADRVIVKPVSEGVQ